MPTHGDGGGGFGLGFGMLDTSAWSGLVVVCMYGSQLD